MSLLETINSPADLKELTVEQLQDLAAEVRQEIISVVSNTGGHLGSNLGAVELTIALHYIYDLPTDQLVWDVSHQCYTHKMLTGRRDRMHTLRQYGGLAGFTKREESEYDHFGTGHASTSISAALGLAIARDNAGLDHSVAVVIGDGSMTGGLAFEGMNNAGSARKNLLVVLNDNTWSISKNVGALSKYLTGITSDEKFNKLRDEVWELTGRFKRRDKIRQTIAHIEHSIKGLLVPGMLFQKLGFRYFGPIDGHDLPQVIRTLQKLKELSGPIMLHVATTKGKGFKPAEGDPAGFHGVGKFDKITGKPASKSAGSPSYTQVFGKTMVELAAKDSRVIAITAAMAPGTGLVDFSRAYPDRFFDVGIAEGHAVCSAAGMAAGGARPYVAIYSTFMQRAYDQVIHDVALQKLPVVFCMDRGGLVGDDGPTHHGAFDLSFMSAVPNVTLAAPRDGNQMRAMLHYTIDHELSGPVAIRYPRETVPVEMTTEITDIKWGEWEILKPLTEVVLVAVGTMVPVAETVADRLLAEGVPVSVVDARFIKPLDTSMLDEITGKARVVVTIEENALRGGLGQTVGAYLLGAGFSGRFKALGLPDQYVTHGNRGQLLKDVGLDAESVFDSVRELSTKRPKNGFFKKLSLRKNGSSRRQNADQAVAVQHEEE
jgi:1-deoxy-D-xylulose-5-phosphate synthase